MSISSMLPYFARTVSDVVRGRHRTEMGFLDHPEDIPDVLSTVPCKKCQLTNIVVAPQNLHVETHAPGAAQTQFYDLSLDDVKTSTKGVVRAGSIAFDPADVDWNELVSIRKSAKAKLGSDPGNLTVHACSADKGSDLCVDVTDDLFYRIKIQHHHG
jgi:hypothetical protein